MCVKEIVKKPGYNTKRAAVRKKISIHSNFTKNDRQPNKKNMKLKRRTKNERTLMAFETNKAPFRHKNNRNHNSSPKNVRMLFVL